MKGSLYRLSDGWTRARLTGYAKELLPGLYRSARRLTRNRGEAEDLVHDAVVKAFRAYASADIRTLDQCRAWLFRIMVNTYRDMYRRRLRSPETDLVTPTRNGGEVNVIELTASRDPGPLAALERKRFYEAVADAMAALPPEVRLVATLYFVEGMTYQEISEATDCSISTVTSRLWRGRQILRKRLAHFREADGLRIGGTAESHGA